MVSQKMNDDIKKVLIDENELKSIVKRLGAEITEDYEDAVKYFRSAIEYSGRSKYCTWSIGREIVNGE